MKKKDWSKEFKRRIDEYTATNPSPGNLMKEVERIHVQINKEMELDMEQRRVRTLKNSLIFGLIAIFFCSFAVVWNLLFISEGWIRVAGTIVNALLVFINIRNFINTRKRVEDLELSIIKRVITL